MAKLKNSDETFLVIFQQCAKRATVPFWKMPKWEASFWKSRGCGQTVLLDKSNKSIGRKLVKNAKIWNREYVRCSRHNDLIRKGHPENRRRNSKKSSNLVKHFHNHNFQLLMLINLIWRLGNLDHNLHLEFAWQLHLLYKTVI